MESVFREPAVNTYGDFMVCLMLVYFNKENTLQQQHNFILCAMCCSTEIKAALDPGIFLSLCIVQFIPTLPLKFFYQEEYIRHKEGRKNL